MTTIWIGDNSVKQLDAKDHDAIIRMNDVLEGEWSFDVLQYEILQNEVVVQCGLTVGENLKVQFGGSRITWNKDGDPQGKPVSIALASAVLDCLQNCANLVDLDSDSDADNDGSSS
jgi:hypothetical protein